MATTRAASVGDEVDRRYAIRREIAHGGMGCVFEAEHLVTAARVALKTLTQAALGRASAHERLLREARILGSLRHPGIVGVHDAGTCQTHGPFVALELIEGRPLDGVLLARQTLTVAQAVALTRELCHALSYVHRHGVVHRDIKPANVLISRTPIGDRVELIDFGIARLGDDIPAVTDSKLTQAGEMLGTVEYMAPEQLMETAEADARADVYALGVLLYESLTGTVPYKGGPTAVMSALLAGKPPASIRELRSDVTLSLDAAVRRALSVDRDARYGSCEELAAACLDALGGVPPILDILRTGDEPSDPESLRRRREDAHTVDERVPRIRRFRRAAYITPLRVLHGAASIDGRCEDISEGGLLAIVDAECEADATVEVRVPLPGSGRVVQLRATARWVRRNRGALALGLEFLDPPAEVRDSIKAYVELMSSEAG